MFYTIFACQGDDEDLGDENKQIGPLTYEVGLMHFILNFKMLVRVFDEHA